MRNLILFLFSTLLLVSCGASSTEPIQSQITNTATTTLSPSPTVTRLSTQLPLSTNTLTPSVTPSRTETSTLTATPSPALPVSLRTPLPALERSIDTENASALRLMGMYSGDPYGVTVVSANGKRAAFASVEGIEIFDLEQNRLVQRLGARIRTNRFDFMRGSFSISADSSILGLVADHDIEVLNSEGKILYSLPDRPNEDYPSLLLMDSIGISPNGKLAAIVECQAGEYTGCPFEVVNIEDRATVYTWDQKMLNLHGSAPVFSPDGTLLATWFDNRVWFWRTADWSAVSNLPLSEEQGWAFSPDGTQVALGIGAIQLWDILERKLLQEFQPESIHVIYPFFSSDGKWLAGADQRGHTIAWNIADGSQTSENWLANPDVARMQVFDGKTEVVRLPGHDSNLWDSSVGQGGFQFAEQDGYTALTLVQNNQGCILNMDGETKCQFADYLVLGSDGQFYQGTEQEKTVEFRASLQEGGILAASLTWSGYLLAPSGIDPVENFLFYSLWNGPNDANTLVIDTEKNKTIKQWNNGWISRVSYSQDGKYAAFVVNHNPRYELVLFDRVNRLPIYQTTFPYGFAPSGVAFSPDNLNMALIIGDSIQQKLVIEMMEIASPHQTTQLELNLPEGVFPYDRAYSPDGTLMAVGLSDGRILLIRISDSSLVFEWQAHNESISHLAFSPDGTLLASADRNGYVKFWGLYP